MFYLFCNFGLIDTSTLTFSCLFALNLRCSKLWQIFNNAMASKSETNVKNAQSSHFVGIILREFSWSRGAMLKMAQNWGQRVLFAFWIVLQCVENGSVAKQCTLLSRLCVLDERIQLIKWRSGGGLLFLDPTFFSSGIADYTKQNICILLYLYTTNLRLLTWTKVDICTD